MSGYIGTQPVPQATQTRQTFVATAAQTSFATGGYSVGYLDVFLNGVKLQDNVDYTATNGSDIVLTVGAALDDTLEVVAYTAFEVLDQTFTGTTTVTDSDAAPLVANRTASDGDITIFQKDGTTVGGIGTKSGNLFIGSTNGSDGHLTFGSNIVFPANSSGDAKGDAIDLGASWGRFKDLYLSGGVYLGGTGAANKLDDYEEGTFTPVFTPASGAFATITQTLYSAKYTKVGRVVHFQIFMEANGVNLGTATGDLRVTGLPFVSSVSSWASASVGYTFAWATPPSFAYVESAQSYIVLRRLTNISSIPTDLASNGNATMIGGSYVTDA